MAVTLWVSDVDEECVVCDHCAGGDAAWLRWPDLRPDTPAGCGLVRDLWETACSVCGRSEWGSVAASGV